MDMAVSPAGDVFTVESRLSRVQVLDSNGNVAAVWGGFGTNPGQFSDPQAIGLDGAENVYVADTDNNRIQVFDSNGNGMLTWGATGSGERPVQPAARPLPG